MPPAQHPTVPTPASPPPAAHPPAAKGPTSDKQLMIKIGVVASIVVVILIVVLLVAAGGSKKPSTGQTSNNDETQGPQPATSLIIDQANNSISQDIAGLHDDTDFPTTTLEDDTLGL